MKPNQVVQSSRLLTALERLKIHDHLCLFYETKEQQIAATVPFMRIGLARGEKCLFVSDEKTSPAFLNAMKQDGVNVDAAMKSGALCLADKKKSYLRKSRFDPDEMLSFLGEATQAAVQEGFSALRGIGEMTWALEGGTEAEKLMEYESKLNLFAPTAPFTAMCQYDRSRFSHDDILKAIQTHPHVTLGDLVCKNFYYVPPDEFLKSDKQPAHKIKRLLNNIAAEQRAVEQLEASWQYARSLIETSPHPLMTVSLDGTVVDVNTPMELVTGITRESLIGSDFLDYFTEHEKAKEGFQKSLTHGTVSDIPLSIRHSSGRITDVLFNASVYRNRDGKIQGVFAAARDITEQKRAQNELQESEEKYRALMNDAGDAIILCDTKGNIVEANIKTETLLDTAKSALLNMHYFQIHPEDELERASSAFKETMRSGSFSLKDSRIIRHDGKKVPVSINSSVIQYAGKKVVQCIFRDITEQKRTEDALRESRRRLEKALSELNEMQDERIRRERLHAVGHISRGIAHDFNNALMPVMGFTELLLAHPEKLSDYETVKKYLELVNTSANDAADAILRLREFYRPREEGGSFGTLDLNKLVKEVIALTQTKWKEQSHAKGITIKIETHLKETPLISGNEAGLREAFTNLIHNAVDAMPEGGVIRFSTRTEGEYVVAEICDTGIGMTEEVRQQCLEPFFTTKSPSGIGIGLPVVELTVQRHNGKIEFESENGKGTTFTLYLPFPAQIPSDKTLLQPEALHVLVVDDEAVVREVIQQYLLNDGHTVETAASGREALEKFHPDKFDIVVTDHGMPDMSGDEMAAEIKKTSQDIPVLLLTGWDDEALVYGVYPESVDIIVSKPVTINALRDAIAKVIKPPKN